MGPRIAVMAYIAFWLAFVFGWVTNVVKLMWLLDDPLSGWFIFRAIAVFVAPIGAVIGYI